MSKLAKKAGKAIQWVVDKAMGSGLMQEETFGDIRILVNQKEGVKADED